VARALGACSSAIGTSRRLLGERPTIGPGARRGGAGRWASCGTAGFDDRTTSLASGALINYASGFAMFESRSSGGAADSAEAKAMADAVMAYFKALPPERYPNLLAVAAIAVDEDDQFEYGLQRLLDGFEADLARGAIEATTTDRPARTRCCCAEPDSQRRCEAATRPRGPSRHGCPGTIGPSDPVRGYPMTFDPNARLDPGQITDRRGMGGRGGLALGGGMYRDAAAVLLMAMVASIRPRTGRGDRAGSRDATSARPARMPTSATTADPRLRQ
jgi:hypothetical protein